MAIGASTVGNTETVVLGSGDLYVAEWSSGALNLQTLAVDANRIGWIQGGATLEYKPETYTVKDDKGMINKTFMTKADATLKSGILTFDVKSLGNIMSVGTVTTDATTHTTTLKLGGGKSSLKRFAVVFVYTDDDTGDKTYIGMVATNTEGLTLAFAADKETVVDATFTAESNGVDDTIVTIEEVKAA